MKKRLQPLFYLLLLVVFIALYANNPTVQSSVNNGVVNAQYYVAQWMNKEFPEHTSKSANPPQQKTVRSTSGQMSGRWKQNKATIYIQMNNPTLQQAMNEAVNAWNNTGTFTFTVVKSKKNADVVATTSDNQGNRAAGVTEMSQMVGTGYFLHGHVYLNEAYLLNPDYGYSHERIVNTAEHELGHAIGLNHTKDVSVMQPAGSFYSIQPTDSEHVRQLYASKQAPATSSSSSSNS